jgi:hypothetical protein
MHRLRYEAALWRQVRETRPCARSPQTAGKRRPFKIGIAQMLVEFERAAQRAPIGSIVFLLVPPKPRIEAVRIVDMTSSNAWAEFAGIFARTKAAHTEHEQAKAELKKLVPEDAHQAIGHGVRAKRSRRSEPIDKSVLTFPEPRRPITPGFDHRINSHL